MNPHLSALCALLEQPGRLSAEEVDRLRSACRALAELTVPAVAPLLTAVRTAAREGDAEREARCETVLASLVQWQRKCEALLDAAAREQISLLYQELDAQSACRPRLLQWLATAASEADLRLFVDLVVADPPAHGQAAAVALAPLFQRVQYDPAVLFPALFAALEHLCLAAPVLDLSNFLCRARHVERHPGWDRRDELIALLGSIVQRLAQLEELPAGAERDWAEVRHQVDEGVALVVALCDALALIGDPRASGKLYQAMELAHRRIRVEAAAALAKLGEAAGVQALVALAAEPVVRLHVLHHTAELGLSDQVDPQYASDVARAEGAVAVELAQPTFFGVPPADLQLVDDRTRFWPGYAEPVRCYLFRFTYRATAGEYSNVAIAGPLVHAFAADLSDLPPDDIYAAYAGWHVEHESIYEVPVDTLPAGERGQLYRFERHLRDAGYEDVQSALLGHFFGDRVLVARAVRAEVAGIAVTDQQEIEWFPHRTRRHPIGPIEAFCIYKGRRLLRAFNH